jgi:hypothetical protein
MRTKLNRKGVAGYAPTIAATVLLFLPLAAMAQGMTFSQFRTQVAAYATATSDVTIEVDQNITLGSLTVPANVNGKTLTIKSINPMQPITLLRGSSGYLFTVPANARLILEELIIEGDESDASLLMVDGGSLVMKNGAVVCNNNTYRGGGVFVNNGTFTMDGGKISGNTARSMVGSGGGVYVYSNGTFIMNGGEISDNTANGSYGYGGGVDVYINGTFIMNGGEISGNTTNGNYGGGVIVSGTFTMNGGEISSNTARDGGGVYVRGTFTMTGGEISGNTASSRPNYGGNGGGVYVNYDGTFNMGGGEISGNTANNGGGVYVGSGTFTMNDGEISGNTTNGNNGGGGVYVGSGTFTMTGGEISDNAANGNYGSGSGVYVYYDGTFNMGGGVVVGVGSSINSIVYGSYNLNSDYLANNGIIIAWNRPYGNGQFVYIEGTNNNLNSSPNRDFIAVWAINDSKSGISYKNGSNEGFIEIADVIVQASTPIRLPQISSSSNILAHAIGNSIVLQNLPANAKVEVFGLNGKLVYSNRVNPSIGDNGVQAIDVQTKGMYIVKVSSGSAKQVLRVAVR